MVDDRRKPDVPLFLENKDDHLRRVSQRVNVSLATDGAVPMLGPLPLVSYLAADEPDATLWEGAIIFVSDEDTVKFSDGTNWIDVGGGGSQTPWTSNIDAAGYDLGDLAQIEIADQINDVQLNLTWDAGGGWLNWTLSGADADVYGAALYAQGIYEIGVYDGGAGTISVPLQESDSPWARYTYWTQAGDSIGWMGFAGSSEMYHYNNAHGGHLLFGSSNSSGTVRMQIDVDPDNRTVGLGNLKFDTAQAVGVSEDDYVLRYDNGTGKISLEAAGGGTVASQWRFDTSTTESDPGNGDFRLDNATPASATEIYISSTTDNGNDIDGILAALASGTRVYMQTDNDSAEFVLMTLTGTVDNTGWWTLQGTIDSSGTLFSNNAKCTALFFGGGGGGGSQTPWTSNIDGAGYALTGVDNYGLITDNAASTPPVVGDGNHTGLYEIYDLDGTEQLAHFGFNASTDLEILSLNRGAEFHITVTDATGALLQVFDADPESATWVRGDRTVNLSAGGVTYLTANAFSGQDLTVLDNGTEVARTIPVASGGWEANNTLTGTGWERVLTDADNGIGIMRMLFNSNTSASAPSSGDIKFNNAGLASATEMYIDDDDAYGDAIQWFLTSMDIGDTFICAHATDKTYSHVFAVTSEPVDNTGWWTVGVNRIGGTGTTYPNNDPLRVIPSYGIGDAYGGVSQLKACTTDTTAQTETALSDVTGLTGFTLEDDTAYAVDGMLKVISNITADYKFGWQFTNTEQEAWMQYLETTDSNGSSTEATIDASTSHTVAASDGNDAIISIKGYIKANATTGGTVDFQMAQQTSDSVVTTVYEGSYINITKIG